METSVKIPHHPKPLDGEEERCAYCKKREKTTSIGELADDIEGAFNLHYYRTPTEPSDFEYTMSKETDYQWERVRRSR